MANRYQRRVPDLSSYPDLVVIYLGMPVQSLRGMKTLLSIGPKIARSVAEQPNGLLLHENILFSLWPLHLGMRQYWRDFDALEAWSHALPHKQWWQEFMRDADNQGVGIWHETYFIRGGFEAIYGGVERPLGLSTFAPMQPARGTMFSARRRLGITEEGHTQAPIAEDVYADR